MIPPWKGKNPIYIDRLILWCTHFLFILCIFFYRNKSDNGSDSKKFSRIYDGDIDAPYKNPIYHNRAYQGQLPIAYPSSGEWSNDGYHQDPYAQYRYPNMRHVDNEDEAFYSFRGSTGGSQHEWNAAWVVMNISIGISLEISSKFYCAVFEKIGYTCVLKLSLHVC